MKYFLLIVLSGFMAAACASPKEKYDDQRMEAKEEYNEDLKEAQEEYQGEETDLRKDRAKKMVDESDDVDVDIEENKIDLEE